MKAKRVLILLATCLCLCSFNVYASQEDMPFTLCFAGEKIKDTVPEIKLNQQQLQEFKLLDTFGKETGLFLDNTNDTKIDITLFSQTSIKKALSLLHDFTSKSERAEQDYEKVLSTRKIKDLCEIARVADFFSIEKLCGPLVCFLSEQIKTSNKIDKDIATLSPQFLYLIGQSMVKGLDNSLNLLVRQKDLSVSFPGYNFLGGSPSGKNLVFVKNNILILADRRTGHECKRLTVKEKISSCNWSEDEERIVINQQKSFSVYTQCQEKYTFTEQKGIAALSPTGDKFIIIHPGNTSFSLYKEDLNQTLYTHDTPSGQKISSATWSYDGRYFVLATKILAYGKQEATCIKVFKVADKTALIHKIYGSAIKDIKWNPTSTIMGILFGNTLDIYNLNDAGKEHCLAFSNDSGIPHKSAFLPNGSIIVAFKKLYYSAWYFTRLNLYDNQANKLSSVDLNLVPATSVIFSGYDLIFYNLNDKANVKFTNLSLDPAQRLLASIENPAQALALLSSLNNKKLKSSLKNVLNAQQCELLHNLKQHLVCPKLKQ